MKEVAGEGEEEGQKKSFGGYGKAHNLDCNDGFMSVHICQNSPNCTI